MTATPIAESQAHTPGPDVIDKFFGFTENMLCSSDNTTDFELDPILLENELGFLGCGKKTTDLMVLDELTLEQNPSAAVQEEVPLNKSNIDVEDTEKNESAESVNTEAETVDEPIDIAEDRALTEINTKPKRKFRIWNFNFGCKGRSVVDGIQQQPVLSEEVEC